MNSIIKVTHFLILLSAIFLFTSFNSISPLLKKNTVLGSHGNTEKFVWLYKFKYNSDNTVLINNHKKIGTSNVFVSVNPNMLYPAGNKKSRRYTASLIDFMNKARKESIKLHFMILETHTFVFTENHSKAKLKLKQLVAFLNENPSYLNNPIVGIHSDVEPHALKAWHHASSWSEKEQIMKQFTQMLKVVKNQIDNTRLENGKKLSSLQFSAAIATWLDSKARDGKLPSGSPQNLKKYVDFIVPMSYLEPSYAREHSTQKKIERIIKNVSPEIEGCPTVIGIDADNFDSFNNITDVYNKLHDNFKGKENYKGICFFRYASMLEFYEKR